MTNHTINNSMANKSITQNHPSTTTLKTLLSTSTSIVHSTKRHGKSETKIGNLSTVSAGNDLLKRIHSRISLKK